MPDGLVCRNKSITFAVGSHDVEVLTGDSLNIINELMRSGASRYGFQQDAQDRPPLLYPPPPEHNTPVLTFTHDNRCYCYCPLRKHTPYMTPYETRSMRVGGLRLGLGVGGLDDGGDV